LELFTYNVTSHTTNTVDLASFPGRSHPVFDCLQYAMAWEQGYIRPLPMTNFLWPDKEGVKLHFDEPTGRQKLISHVV